MLEFIANGAAKHSRQTVRNAVCRHSIPLLFSRSHSWLNPIRICRCLSPPAADHCPPHQKSIPPPPTTSPPKQTPTYHPSPGKSSLVVVDTPAPRPNSSTPTAITNRFRPPSQTTTTPVLRSCLTTVPAFATTTSTSQPSFCSSGPPIPRSTPTNVSQRWL